MARRKMSDLEKFTQAVTPLTNGQRVDVNAAIRKALPEVAASIIGSGRSDEVLMAAVRLAMEVVAFRADASRDDEVFDAKHFVGLAVWAIGDPVAVKTRAVPAQTARPTAVAKEVLS